MSVLTISRQFGCGGEYVAERVAAHLKWRLLNKELVKYASILTGRSDADQQRFDEESHSTWGAILSKYVDLNLFSNVFTNDIEDEKPPNKPSIFDEYKTTEPVFDSSTFQNAMERVIRKVADAEDAVIVGRGGQSILQERDDAFHVRLIADFDDRVGWLMSRESLSEAEAATRIRETDKRKKKFLSHYYKHDIDDASLYHMVVNMSRLSIDQTTKIVEHACRTREP